jgi:AraC family transcriptional regulator of adaptative response/methylated-DNA-[protein]-cysteine methyltransferase
MQPVMEPAVDGDGQTIRFTVATCDLGWVAIAATPRGLCMIELADDPNDLRGKVNERFPNAQLEEVDAVFSEMVSQVLQLISTPSQSSNLPLDIQGTAFQRKVWDALRNIPVGATVTYSEIASAIGQPTASRAVARACASNPVAVAIPCHRVVGKNGDLSGYRWGIERKRELLNLETSTTPDEHE